MLFAFSPVLATAVKISVTEVDFGGYYGGGIPPWWSPTEDGNAFLHALQVYAGTDTVDQVDGTGLTPLTDQDAAAATPDDDDDHHHHDHHHHDRPPPRRPPRTPTTTTTTTPPSGPGHGGNDHRHPAQVPTVPGLLADHEQRKHLHVRIGALLRVGRSRPLDCTRSSAWWRRPTARATGWSSSTGGVFTFGDAGFYGSTGSLVLNKPIVGMATTPRRQGLLAGGLRRRDLLLR